MKVAKPMRVSGVMTAIFLSLRNAWNFIPRIRTGGALEVLYALNISAIVALSLSRRVGQDQTGTFPY